MPISLTIKTTKSDSFETILKPIKAGVITLKSASIILDTTRANYYSVSVEIGNIMSSTFLASDKASLNFLDILLEQNKTAAILDSLTNPDISFNMSGDLDTSFAVRIYSGDTNQLVPDIYIIFIGLHFQIDY